nr:hypothetical protein [Tanacetum cinerariifolium]
IASRSWSFASTVPGQMTYLVASLTLDSAKSCVMQGVSCTQRRVSMVPFIFSIYFVLSWGGSISLDSFLPSIMLFVVIVFTVVIIAVILIFFVVAIVGVVIVVAIIGVVIVVMIIGVVVVVVVTKLSLSLSQISFIGMTRDLSYRHFFRLETWKIASHSWSFAFAVPGQMTHLATIRQLIVDSVAAALEVQASTMIASRGWSFAFTVPVYFVLSWGGSISLDSFLPSILLFVVIVFTVVIIAVILIFFVVAIVGVVIVVAIIGVVIVVMIIGVVVVVVVGDVDVLLGAILSTIQRKFLEFKTSKDRYEDNGMSDLIRGLVTKLEKRCSHGMIHNELSNSAKIDSSEG